MRAEDLREVLSRRPFQPVRLLITSGEHVDIVHPELAIVSRSLVAVGIPRKRSDRIADAIVHYNLLHVVKIEPLNGHRPRANGRSRKR